MTVVVHSYTACIKITILVKIVKNYFCCVASYAFK
jgi:hypothetical protein